MDIALDEVLHFDAITHHPSTGAVTDADSTPTWSIFEEDTDTPILSAQNFTKRTSLTGNYRGSAALSTANGFEIGKWYNVIGSATVNSIAGKAVVMRFRVCAAETVAGTPNANATHAAGTAWGSGAITAASLAADAGAEIFAAVLTSQMTEAYAADGTAPTLAQAVFLIQQVLTEMSISGTTTTVKKLDGSTTAATLTLNSATSPTSVTRAS